MTQEEKQERRAWNEIILEKEERHRREMTFIHFTARQRPIPDWLTVDPAFAADLDAKLQAKRQELQAKPKPKL